VEALGLAVPDQVQVPQLDGAALLDDRRRRPPHGLDPVGQVLGVGHRGRQAHEAHVGRRVDDHLLPHRPPVLVPQVVDLVEYDEAQPVEGGRPGVDHVPEHLGGHDHGRGLAGDGVVPREQAHPVRAVPAGEVAELLVGQGLERRRVERLAPLGQGLRHGVLGDDGLARARGCRHQHVPSLVQGVEGLDLKVVELERVRLGELLAVHGRPLIASAGGR
jgi:hypothetical protein